MLLGAPSVDDLQEMLFDFSIPATSESWQSIDDRVMGGVSESELASSEKRSAIFRGRVSLENRGGFASVRSAVERRDWSGIERLVLRVRGDGKTYSINMKTDPGFDGISYRASFTAPADEWTTVVLPIRSFRPVFRGRPVANAGPLDLSRIYSVGFMIAGKQEGSFELEIESITGRQGGLPATR
jgi:hypothetical protein